jgi:DNA polymerase alpha-associated DNA helicase A
MQLPPTVLALGHGGKKTKIKNGSKGNTKEKGTSKAQTKNKGTSTVASKVSKTEEPEPPVSETTLSTDIDSQSGSELEPTMGQISSLKSTLLKTKKAQKKKAFVPSGLVPPRTLETTMFDRLERMYGPTIKRMLEVQYRYFLFPQGEFLTIVLTCLVVQNAYANMRISI